eukprot:CAMPEP_0174888396 /NCGR_PEP_ID=MMETSP0167-20121228/3685_1 /TAXON_ID=38298 /ORGANISM="Rhodella maculata, Strain CCMP736" /LENGTH=148 /DNA_ID=CAMNT_0016125365 /DNA_START=50 /DNA_END=496 /DNA_ORIENTATION=+
MKELKDMLMKGEINFAGLDPSLILSEYQVMIAAQIATLKLVRSELVTKNVHSEIIYRLSASTNISTAFSKFGFKADGSTLLAVRVVEGGENPASLDEIILGTEVPLGHLEGRADRDKIRKLYKVIAMEAEAGSLLDSVICRIGAADCA